MKGLAASVDLTGSESSRTMMRCYEADDGTVQDASAPAAVPSKLTAAHRRRHRT
jgi:hypothetical protein